MSQPANIIYTHFAKVFPEHQRIGILPKYFPCNYLTVENMIYSIAEKLSKNYHGGFWQFYELANGGFYMAPDMKQQLQIEIPFGNHYSGIVSPDAFGIIVCIYAYGVLGQDFPDLLNHYTKLYDHASHHPEFDAIFWALD